MASTMAEYSSCDLVEPRQSQSQQVRGDGPVAQKPSFVDLGYQIGRIAVGCFKKVQQFPFHDMALESGKEILNHVEASVNGKNPQQETGQRHSQARSAGQAVVALSDHSGPTDVVVSTSYSPDVRALVLASLQTDSPTHPWWSSWIVWFFAWSLTWVNVCQGAMHIIAWAISTFINMALALQHPTAPTSIWGEYKHLVRALQDFIFAIMIGPILYSLWDSGSFWIHALAIVLVFQILRAIYKTGRKCIQLCALIAKFFSLERYRVLRLGLFGLLLALFMTMIIWAYSTFIF